MTKKILVLAEMKDGNLRNVSIEGLAAARRVAQDSEVIAAVFGSNATEQTSILQQYGADTIYIVDNPNLNLYTPSAYMQSMNELIQTIKPDVIIMGHTAVGKDLAPRLAARLGIGLVSDATNLTVENGEIVFTRPIYSGKVFQKKKSISSTVFATIRPNNIPALEADTTNVAKVVSHPVDITDLRTVITEVVKKASSGVDLTEAKIIVSGGRGVKSVDGFNVLKELADLLGAGVGASRGACDASFCDYSMQIGQTGKVVTPDLYIACGISGAIQHLAGMSNSKIIVAINKDPEAPIFKVADYGIVGDLFEVVPLLTEEFKKVLDGAVV
ncbi:electron transfer flavoprotein subunit alpha/FixB family protein [Lysinibacillus sp. BW-2-10]|uniref:electron transfer flavoprotein subunit alpha/FixB family protein n=1 Tax=Lysinibacillus sp. BW-2-10 TaxID=2590030 RepID=UPI0011815643|nr:electron transfer flavoprotein subunit alpha/FixB family protein [Lysinibacillus sp. BW-2-10]TSI09308.1 electron transfer flavoprotein subunit alpha/FixB family protein [Lysinibacillus sp. BW-2-10]